MCVLHQALQRTVKDNGGDLVIATLCLIQVSKLGLLETEVLELLAMTPTLPDTTTDSHHQHTGVTLPSPLPMAQVQLGPEIALPA